MIKYAIITEFENIPATGFLKFLNRRLKKNTYNIMFSTITKTLYEYVTLPPNNQNVLICRLPLSKSSLPSLSDAVLTKILNKTHLRLCEMNADTLLISPALKSDNLIKKYFDDLGYQTFDGLSVLDFYAPEIIRRLSKAQNVDLSMLSTGVFEQSFGERGISMVMSLSDYLKYITIFTKDITRAESIANRLYEYTGLSAYVTDDLNFLRYGLIVALDELDPKEIKLSPNTAFLDLSGKRRRVDPLVTFNLSGDYKFMHQILGDAITPDCLEFIINAISGSEIYNKKAFDALCGSENFSIKSISNINLSAPRTHLG